MSKEQIGLMDVNVPKRYASFLEYNITEKIHFDKIGKITENRVLRTLDSGICEYWAGQAQAVLKALTVAYNIRFMVHTKDGKFRIRMPRLPGDDVAGFVQDLEVRFGLMSGKKQAIYNYSDHQQIQLYIWYAQAVLPMDIMGELFRKHFVQNDKGMALARQAIEGHKTLVFQREYPTGYFS